MPDLVLLHGFTQTGASWGPVAERAGERYTAVAPDLPGHGAAGDVRPITFETCVARVLDAAPARFVLAGYSMGGRIALHVALAAPDRVARLVLVSATPGIADEIEREARRADDERLADEIEREDDIEAFARRWAAQPLFKGQSREVAEALHEDRLRNEPRNLAAALRGVGTGAMAPLWSRLGTLRMPVTLIAGERDGKFRKIAERMAAAIPDAELHVVPATGHAVHAEAPAIVAGLL